MTLTYWLRDRYEKSPRFVRQLAGPLAGRLPDDWRYGPAFARTRRLLIESSAWSEAELAEYQLAQLRELLVFAGRRVPYYRRVFAERGFRPEAVQSVEELQQLPLLTRDMVRRLGRALAPDDLRQGAYKFTVTGGTSGYPLGFYLTHDASLAEWAYQLHQWRSVGFRSGDLRLVFGSGAPEGRDQGRYWAVDPVNHYIRFSGYDMHAATLPRYVAAIQAHRPLYLHAYPSVATMLAQYLDRSGQRLPSLRGLLLGSENVYPGQREFLERVFACPALTWYGHTEKCILACERPGSRDYHPFPQYGVTELVDADGQHITQPGQRGQLVGTGFLNRATVFIRYLTDDDAEWADGPCACGCHSRRLRHVQGRWRQEMMMGRSGSLFPAAHMILTSEIFMRMQRFQFYQDTPGEAVLRIVKTPEYTANDEAAILKILQNKAGKEVNFKPEYVTDLPLTPSGKFKFVVQRLALDYPRWDRNEPASVAGSAPEAS